MPETDNDPSASTASFRAFAQRSDEDVAPGRVRSASSNRTIIMVAAVVCVLIVIGVLVATL
jgi:hypothetical protein